MAGLISGMAYVRLSAPDLGRMRAFLTDFGMADAGGNDDRLYMRGLGTSPFIHVTERGESGVVAFAYDLRDDSLLAEAARLPGASGIESIDEPGGGRRVRLRDPNGLSIELVADRERAEPLLARPLVRGADGESRGGGAARVRRLAHAAYATPKETLPSLIRWYSDTLGLLPTDELYIDQPDNVLGRFIRVDAGDEPVDHHVLFLLRGARPGMHHASFEVEGVDDIFFGLDHMKRATHDHVRGIGRHALGSQIFNYWMSPFGQMHEHWIGNEKMVASSRFNHIKIGEGMTHDTGEAPPERFVKQATPIVPRGAASEVTP